MEKLRVLIVDDQQALRTVVRRVLSDGRIPMEIVEAESGAEALQKVEDGPFDLVILDVIMPGQYNGFDVLRLLREREASKDLPIVMLTAEDKEQDIMQGLEDGATSYLTKPFNSDELWEVVEPLMTEKTVEQKPKNILVVDDEASVRKVLRRALAGSRFENTVVEAEDGKEALDKINQSKFDMVVMDVSMPRLSGLEALKQIRQTEEHKDLTVIMLTGESDPDDIREGLRGGASTYLTKPFQPDDVVLVVDYHLALIGG